MADEERAESQVAVDAPIRRMLEPWCARRTRTTLVSMTRRVRS